MSVANPSSLQASCSGFIADAINDRLHELRLEVALHRHFVNQWRNRTYWDESKDSQHKRCRFIREQMRETRIAEDALRAFIAEHRSLMGKDWIGNDHGRLCFSWFMGGRPIDMHYCSEPEGHDGFCQSDKGSWPRGVHGDREWWDRRAACKHERSIDWDGVMKCIGCGLDLSRKPVRSGG